MTITSGSSGSGNGTVTYSVTANNTTDLRMGTMTIAGQTFTVLQDHISCTYTMTPTNKNLASTGGSDSISVTANTGCAWTASSNAAWITITSSSSGSGNGTVTYTVAANTGTTYRTGTMTIAGQTFTVTQDGQSVTKKTLTIIKQGTGNGSITPSTGTITWTGNQGTTDYDPDTSVTLTAEGDMSSDFGTWSGCDTVASNVCTVRMSASRTVVVTFNLKTKGVMLTVTKTGTGDGTVMPSTGVLTFNGNMAMTEYPADSQVILTGTPADGSTFVAWTGCDVPIGNKCTVTMTAEKIIAIEFKKATTGKKPKKDFNGDGKSDVIWRNFTTGDVAIWQMDGMTRKFALFAARNVPNNWQVRAAEDFDGDGKADMLWQDVTTGDVYVWLLNDGTAKSGAYVARGIPAGWQIKLSEDFDGDGKADVLWQNTNTGAVYIWLMNGAAIASGGHAVRPSQWSIY
ncbi:MAG: VCBS repeat-containing protein [Magnetococcales bacterium]|nr:VCBS repeat-containing protein [Nitrospirota bacterium]